MNKVKYGLKNVHVWPITAATDTSTTYGDVIKIPGAVNISLSASGGSDDFYADDGIYYNVNSNNGYEGDLEIALIPDEFSTQILGMTTDANGVLFENNDDVQKNYALAFEFSGDVNKTRHILYNCTSSRANIESETIKENKSPKTDKLTIKAIKRLDNGDVKARIRSDQTGYDTFFTTPYEKTTSQV